MSLVFGMPEFRGMIYNCSIASSSAQLPIVLYLLCDRASLHIDKQDYNQRNSTTKILASFWKVVFLEWLNECRHPGQLQEFVTTLNYIKLVAIDQHKQQKKRKHIANSDNPRPHKYCCVQGCKGKNQNAELIHVTDYPPSLSANSSHKLQTTYFKKNFIQSECSYLLGLGRDFQGDDIPACNEH